MNSWMLAIFVDTFVMCMTVTIVLLTCKKALEWIQEINQLLKSIRKKG